MDKQKMSRDLKILEGTYNGSEWLKNHDHEPLIGDPDCPDLAQEYGMTRVSCYSVFLERINDATYRCRFERCRGFAPCSLEDALRHQRYNHFDHRPFLCAPVNGGQWYVVSIGTLSFRAQLVDSNHRFYARGDLINHQKRCFSLSV